ncbi:MAG: hypothetical protein IIZ06_00285, partial [Kiritimatiellae bacterium]|nr:hypothetical protein [Kiritimatiellia bacterium]
VLPKQQRPLRSLLHGVSPTSPFINNLTSRNSRLAFVFLAIAFASFRVILPNHAVSLPKTTPFQGSLPAESLPKSPPSQGSLPAESAVYKYALTLLTASPDAAPLPDIDCLTTRPL